MQAKNILYRGYLKGREKEKKTLKDNFLRSSYQLVQKVYLGRFYDDTHQYGNQAEFSRSVF